MHAVPLVLRESASSRPTVNVAQSLRCRQPLRVARRPDLWVLDGFLGEHEVGEVLARMASERWVEEHALHVVSSASGFAAEVLAHGDDLFGRIARRIAGFTGIASVGPSTLRFRYYAEGQGQPLHGDWFEDDGQHMVLTTLVYLTDTERGGETTFPYAQPGGVTVSPRRGRLAVWTSARADGQPDPAARHAAHPVLRGEKAVLACFTYVPRAQRVTELQPTWATTHARL